MNVLHIGKYYPPFFGGVEKVNYDIVEGLNHKGIQTDVLCFNHEKGKKVESRNNYKVYRSSVLFNIAGQPVSYSFFKTFNKILNNYDVLHLHLPNPLVSLFCLKVKSDIKLVVHWHNDIIRQKIFYLFYKPFETLLLKKADRVIVTSPQYLKSSKPLTDFSDKCNIVPIGVDKDDIAINENRFDTLKNKYTGKKVVFSLGRLSKYKGYNYLIESAEYFTDDVVLLIAGVGEEEENLNKIIKQRNLSNRVKLIGKIPFNELGAYYKLCDIFCMSSISRNEGFGIVQIEAMLFRKPIITTKIEGSGIAYGNIHEETGVVVPVKNSKAIANAVNKIIKTPALAKKYGENGFKRARTVFSKENMINRTIEVYSEL